MVVRVAQTAPEGRGVRSTRDEQGERGHGIVRMRFALGVDVTAASFTGASWRPADRASLRRRAWLRVGRRPEPFEALVWAMCEQLIEYRAGGRDREQGGRRPGTALAGQRPDVGERAAGPADGGGAGRSRAGDAGVLRSRRRACDRARRAAREVAGGRVDLHEAEPERGWRRLRAIPGIGAWTVEMLALRGQGRYDQLPAGDLGLLKLVGRILSGGDPRARADEEQVRELFAPYGEWAGLAAVHAVGL